MSSERLTDTSESVEVPSFSLASTLPDAQNLTLNAPTVAHYPFDDQSADVILRTSDNVLFHVYKSTLIYASGFFRDLFAIPRESLDDAGTSRCPPIELDVPEDSEVLEMVLHWCYPIPHPEPTRIAVIKRILAVAVKYDMAGVISYMRRPLGDLHQSQPIQVYAVACTFGFSDMAAKSAEVLRQRQQTNPQSTAQHAEWNTTVTYSIHASELAYIPAASFLRLLKFVKTGIKPVDFCQPEESERPRVSETYQPIHILHSSGDLIIRSELDDSIDFKVHRQIISFSSPALEEKIQSIAEMPTNLEGLPILILPEGSTILGLLLRSCYPSGDLDPANFDPSDVPLLAASATKYGVEKAITSCKKRLAELIPTQPFRSYHMSIQCDWQDEARNAALRLARLGVEEAYDISMENMEAEHYYRLLEFCHLYRKAVFAIGTKFKGRYIDFTTQCTFNQVYVQSKEMWDTQERHLQDVACIIPLLAIVPTTCNTYRSNYGYPVVTPFEPSVHLQEVYKETSEQLGKIQLRWGGFTEDGRPKNKKKGKR